MMTSKIIAPCVAASVLISTIYSGSVNAFLSSSISDNSIAWSYQEVALGKVGQDIRYPLCIPQEKMATPEGLVFVETTNKVASEWNEHAKLAIGSDWPAKSITFHTDITEQDCANKVFKHASGVTIKPFTVEMRAFGSFDASDHRVRIREDQFDNITGWYSIYLHEFGHILGLSDDYKGIAHQGGRPPSMMKMHTALQEEDKVALRHMWYNRGNYANASCPDTHFEIDDGYHGIFWSAGSKSCLPYLRDNINNNMYLDKFGVADPDNCIVFLDDPNSDVTLFRDAGDQIRKREQNPKNYFAGEPTHAPVCLTERTPSGELKPLSVLLSLDNMNKADSLWVGKNVHVNLRMLRQQGQDRFVTVKEAKYYHPYAWFDHQWRLFDKVLNKEVDADFDAVSVSLVDKNKEMVLENIAELDLQRSAAFNPFTWPEPQVLAQMIADRPGQSCADTNVATRGIYRIARDQLSDQEVHCEPAESGPAWTYIGFSDAMATFKSFFHYVYGVVNIEDIDLHGDEQYTYSNGLTSKIQDNEMLIKIRDFHNGPKVFFKYQEADTDLFNDMYHRSCEDLKTYDIQVKIDWPDDEHATWAGKEQWPDNVYHDAVLSCRYPHPHYQHLHLNYKDKSLGANGLVLTFRLNLPHGILLSNEEWNQNNPPENPIDPNKLDKKNQKAWIFVRNLNNSASSHEWAFDEGAGTVALDSVGGNTGMISGAQWGAGAMNTGLVFDAANDVVEIADYAVNTQASFSVSAWVKFNSLNGWQTAVSQDGVNVSGFYLQKTTMGSFAFAMYERDLVAAKVIRAESSFNPKVSTWYHLVGVHDARSQQIKLFVDGKLVSTKPYRSTWLATGNTAIGRALWASEKVDYFSGTIDEVKVFDNAISDTYVQSLFASESAAVVNSLSF